MGEFDIIARHFASLSQDEAGAFGLTDDAAVLSIGTGQQMVVTSDCLVADVHFLATDPPETIARKVLGVNLSDLAAMGARSRAYTLAAAWPTPVDESWIAGFAAGLKTAQIDWQVTLIGGDTVATNGPLTLTVTAFGEVGEGAALTRAGAKPGDDIYVSGTLGDAALGLLAIKGKLGALQDDHAAYLIDRYRCPQPRVALGPQLQGIAICAIDISDGLIADLGHVTDESGVSATIEIAELPLSEAARIVLEGTPDHLTTVLTGGDDYELLFTAPPTLRADIFRLPTQTTRIGTIGERKSAPPITLTGADGASVPLPPKTGYRHF